MPDISLFTFNQSTMVPSFMVGDKLRTLIWIAHIAMVKLTP